MSLLGIFQTIAGVLFALFVPGYLAAELIFREMEFKEKAGVGIALSIGIDILIGIFLGYNRRQKEVTGGITAYNAWFYLLVITAVLGTAVLVKALGNWMKTREKDSRGNKK